MDLDLSGRHALAVDVARRAGEHLRALYAKRSELLIEEKGPNDLVSRADREAEALIKSAVLAQFPSDGFVGEETGVSGHLGDSAAIWVVDPLDGTTNFLRGAHNWCVSIAIVVAGEPAVGVVFDPLRDEMFEGWSGAGARVNGEVLHVSPVTEPASATIGLGFVKRVGAARFCADTQNLLGSGLSFRQLGAGALMLAYVAAGRVDSYFERHMWPWDALGGLALIRAAGGRMVPYPADNAEITTGGLVLAAGPMLFDRLRDIVAV